MKALTTVAAVVIFFACGPVLAHGRLADISVYDRTAGRWLQVYRHEGHAYVVGKRGHEYQVRVANRLREDLLAVASVDGVNVITGETAHASQSGYVLSPRGSLDINGWRKSLSETAAFYFTSLPDSYAARTGRPDDTVPDSQLGTGDGQRQHSPAVHVTFERATSTPAEVITLYYDSYANLAVHGIIREPIHVAPTPRPFPGFVPDPRG
jgi:hypothetical protein